MTRTSLALLTLVLVSGPAVAGRPSPRTIHDRVLGSSFIAIARLSPAEKSERGALFELEVREVLVPEKGGVDASKLLLDNRIPSGSSFGLRCPVPSDVDVVVFANRFGDRLFLLNWCANSIVPLREKLEEYPGPKYGAREMSGKVFLALVRDQITRMRDYDYLEKSYRGAIGSVHPFSAHDRPALLGRLLALPDERVPGLARKLMAQGVTTRERLVLFSYFAREADGAGIPVLRARFLELHGAWKAGELGGVEDYDHIGGMTENRPRDERLLDVARVLVGAGDGDFVSGHLLPAFREGFGRAGDVLIRAANEEVLRTLVERARSWKGETERGRPTNEAAAILIGSRERSCVLAVVRVALSRESVEEARLILDVVRRQGIGPGVSFKPGWMSVEQQPKVREKLRVAWHAWWRENAGRLPSVYPPGALDGILGKDPDWRAGSTGEDDR